MSKITNFEQKLVSLASDSNVKQEIAEYVKENAALDTQEKRQSIAEIVYVMVKEQIVTYDWISEIIDISDIPFEATPVKRQRTSGLEAIQLSDRADAPMRFTTVRDQLINTYRYAGGTNATRRELASGRIDTLQDMAQEIRAQMQGQMSVAVWNLLKASSVTGQPNYFDFDTTYKNTLDKAIRYLSDFGVIKGIVGLASNGIWDVTDFAPYGQDRLNEKDKKVFLGDYRGIPLVKVNQVYKTDSGELSFLDGTPLITGDVVFAIIEGAGVGFTQGGIVEETAKDIKKGVVEMVLETYFGAAIIAPRTRVAQIEIKP